MVCGTEQIDYYYNPLGGVEKYDFSDGEDLYYNYYSTGLTSQRAIESYEVDFTYDTLGNRTQITDPFGLQVDYQYNSLNRVTDIDVDNKNFSYEYYADGMIKAVDYPNGLRAEYTYDNMNRLLTLTNKLNGTSISQFSYQYDSNSNIISVNNNGQTTTYQYDELNRLTGISRPNSEIITYQYDSRGNRTEMNGTDIDPDNFIPGTFTYNIWDEMDSFTPTDGDTTSYEYDPEGLRTKKTTPSFTTRYHCDDKGLVIAESDANATVIAQNIWGHKPLARKIGSSYYYNVYNGHGDVIQVLDESGNAVNTYEYDEWGNILSISEQIENPIRYAGEYYDEESGLYYLRARYYDPVIGRFISKDSVEGDITNPLSLNLYTYCVNNPLAFIDPSGNDYVWNRFGEVIGTTTGSTYTDYSQAATDRYGGEQYKSTPWTGGSSSSGTSSSSSSSSGGTSSSGGSYGSSGSSSSSISISNLIASNQSIGEQIWAGMSQVPGALSNAGRELPGAIFNNDVGKAALQTGGTVIGGHAITTAKAMGMAVCTGYGPEVIRYSVDVGNDVKTYIYLNGYKINEITVAIEDFVGGGAPQSLPTFIKNIIQNISQ